VIRRGPPGVHHRPLGGTYQLPPRNITVKCRPLSIRLAVHCQTLPTRSSTPWTGSSRMCVHWLSAAAACVITRSVFRPSPRPISSIRRSGCKLPFLLGRQPFAGPLSIRLRIAVADIDDGMVFEAIWNSPIYEVSKEIGVVLRMVTRNSYERRVLAVGNRIPVNPESLQIHLAGKRR
jgi:hypothetical protein